jgi:hypothetical protein
MNITVKVIPHNKQRYETVGDWWFDKKGNLQVRVSAMDSWRYECLVAIHEVVEACGCKYWSIAEKDVSKFDKAYEKKRKAGDTSEPGDDSNAPYRAQHCLATGVERCAAVLFGVGWKHYEDKINSL